MQHYFVLEKVAVVGDGFEVGLVGCLVLETALEGLGCHVVDFGKMFGLLRVWLVSERTVFSLDLGW